MGKKKDIDTGFSYSGGEYGYFSSNEDKWINAILKYAENEKNNITVIRKPTKNDYSIYAKVPVTFFRLTPKSTRTLTDEQREAARERAKRLAAARHAEKEKPNVTE